MKNITLIICIVVSLVLITMIVSSIRQKKSDNASGTSTNEDSYIAVLPDRFHDPKDKALVEAIIKGDMSALDDSIRSGANLNADGDYGKSPLAVAIIARRKNALDALLKAGANPNHRDVNGAVAAVEAVVTEDGRYLAALLGAGLDPSVKNGNTPLVNLAITEARLDHYHTLVDKGADLNAKTSSGRTIASLLIAVSWFDEVKDLIERNGDFTSGYGKKNITPAQELIDLQNRFGGDPDGQPFLKRVELLRMMRDRGVKIPEGVPGM